MDGGTASQVVEAIVSNMTDLHSIYMLYLNGNNPFLKMYIDNESTIAMLRTKFKLGTAPKRRNTFPELYFEYSETHFTPVTYQLWGIDRSVKYTLESMNKYFRVLLESLSFMSEKEVNETISKMEENSGRISYLKYTIPSLDLLGKFWNHYSKYMGAGAANVEHSIAPLIFGMVCSHGENDLKRQMWDEILTKYPQSLDQMRLMWCLGSLIGGYHNLQKDIIDKHYVEIVKALIYHKKIDFLRELIEYRRRYSNDVKDDKFKNHSPELDAVMTNDIEIIKLVVGAFGRLHHTTLNLGSVKLEIIKFLELESIPTIPIITPGQPEPLVTMIPPYGEDVMKSVSSYLLRKNLDVFEYVTSKYKVKSIIDVYDVIKNAAIRGYKDIYLKYIKDYQITSVTLSEIIFFFEETLHNCSDFYLDILFGKEHPTILIVDANYAGQERISHTLGIKYKFVDKRIGDPLRLEMDDYRTMKNVGEIDTILKEELERITSLVDDIGREDHALFLKRLAPYLSPTLKVELMIRYAKHRCYGSFRSILSPVPKETDMTQIINYFVANHDDLHGRFLQIIVREGFSYNSLLLTPEARVKVEKMI